MPEIINSPFYDRAETDLEFGPWKDERIAAGLTLDHSVWVGQRDRAIGRQQETAMRGRWDIKRERLAQLAEEVS